MLDVNAGYFFEAEMDASVFKFPSGQCPRPELSVVDSDFRTTDAAELNRLFSRIRDPKARKSIVDLAKSVASDPALSDKSAAS